MPGVKRTPSFQPKSRNGAKVRSGATTAPAAMAAAKKTIAAQKNPRRRWPVNLDEFEEVAKGRLTPLAYAYIAGGAGDERTKNRNCAAFAAIKLKPRMLVDVSHLDTRLELFGQDFADPILLAPTAYHKLAHENGELRVRPRSRSRRALYMVVSTLASTHFVDIAALVRQCARLWFSSISTPDRGFTRELVERVQAAGCKALCLTVDSPLFGTRDREARVEFSSCPLGLRAEHFTTVGGEKLGHVPVGDIYSPMVDPTVTWKDVEWLCSTAKVPVLLKGILAPEDARMAKGEARRPRHHRNARIMAGGIWGHRFRRRSRRLPRVVEAVGGRIAVLLDGGIRRGSFRRV